ncbi:249_t:CDS:1, partial [Racocetra persica]
AKTIRNCWHHTKILSSDAGFKIQNLPNDICRTNDLVLDRFINALSSFCLSNAMKTDKFLMINDENIVYKISEDDQIIKELAYMFKKDASIETIDKNSAEIDDENDSIEITTISGSSALNNLENICLFLFQVSNSS